MTTRLISIAALTIGLLLPVSLPAIADNETPPAPVEIVRVPTQDVPASAAASDDHIRSIVFDTISNLFASGVFGVKGSGAPVNFDSVSVFDENAEPFTPVYIPAAVLPGTGSLITASQVSADTATVANANLGETAVDGNLSVSGETTLATTTAGNLHLAGLTSDSGAYLSDGGDWVNVSSRELKENFVTSSLDEALAKIEALPIFTWNYKTQPTVTHIGPVAEDFHSAFGVGDDKSISTIDPAGVALLGVQGLIQKIKPLFDFSWVIGGLKNLGIEIGNGIVTMKQVFSDLIHTNALTIGTPDQPTGITIFDRATHEPVCIFSEHGALKSELGECDAAQTNTPTQTNPTFGVLEEGSAPATEVSTTTDVLETASSSEALSSSATPPASE